MHIGILVLMNMGPFSWISMAYYLCLWRPEELEALARKLFRRASSPQPTVDAEAGVGEGA
jgi:hypothetical protein